MNGDGMNMIKDFILDGEPTLVEIWDEYVEDLEPIPTEEAKSYFRSMSGRVDPKLVRQCIYAGAYFASKHPGSARIIEQGSGE